MFELSPQWGINRGRTSHYLQYVQHQFWVCFIVITFVFIHYHNKFLFESSSNIYHVFTLRLYVYSLGLDLGLHFL
jgi:hypothetical protein